MTSVGLTDFRYITAEQINGCDVKANQRNFTYM